MENDDVPLSVLGNSLKCPKGHGFAQIIRQEIGTDYIELFLKCPKCGSEFRNKYTFAQYERMANMSLIDPPEIKDYQKKMVVFHGRLPRLERGLDGAFYVDQRAKAEVLRIGQKLLCKCHKFYSLSIKAFKKDTIVFNGYCPICTKKGKKIKIPLEAAAYLGKAGIIEPELMSKIREYYVDDREMFDVSETYTANDGTLATWAQEALGMRGEKGKSKCYMCGAVVSEDMERCPKCGADLDLFD